MTGTSESGNGSLTPEIFDGVWWSVELPEDWIVQGDEHCATFQAKAPLGAMQVSSARKDHGDVTDDDLHGFAEERISRGLELERVEYGSFSGFCISYTNAGSFWKEWWLRSLGLMIYVTYNVEDGCQILEEQYVNRILASLKAIRP